EARLESFPRGQRTPQAQLLSRWLIMGAALVIVIFVTLGGADFLTEWLWFDSLGLTSVFATSILARLALFFAGAAAFLALFAINVLIARRLASSTEVRPRQPVSNGPWDDLLRQIGSQMPAGGSSYR